MTLTMNNDIDYLFSCCSRTIASDGYMGITLDGCMVFVGVDDLKPALNRINERGFVGWSGIPWA